MEEVSICKNSVEIKFVCRCLCDGGVCSVIDNTGSTNGSTIFKEIDSKTVTATNDMRAVNANSCQSTNGSITDGVVWYLR